MEEKKGSTLIETLQRAQEQGADEDGLQRLFSLYMQQKSRFFGNPEFGIFELTPQCNFDCRMCYVHLKKEQMQGRTELDGDQWIRLADDAIAAGMMKAQLTGGEAMLHPDFDRIYLHLHEKGIRTTVMTNGLLLNERRVAFFKEHPPASLQITLYGNDEDGYERLTGVRACGLVRENIIRAKEIGCRMVLSATPSVYFGPEEVRGAFAFAKEQEIRFQVNSDLSTPYEETGRETASMELSREDYFKIRRMMLEESGQEIRPYEGEPPLPASFTDGHKERRGLGCSSGKALFCINWKGEMMACLDLSFREYPLEIGFEEAWRRIHAQAVDYPVPSACFDCAYLKVCNPCPALHAKGAPAGEPDRRICARIRELVREGLVKLP